eukprot:TRINITY_DN529_c0_g2_i1.p1 TRINITY_DN529_c0_g2~~TRINITY_DN529_c0_g2_i1.p1  ORF type:complete len:454 (-),score=75.41 TRINITY_DN529_c0_g2_i1:355-1716(-)
MASRYPPGQDHYHRSSYTNSSHPSKQHYTPSPHSTTTYNSSNRHNSHSSVRSPPPPAAERYLSSMTFSNSYIAQDRDPPPRSGGYYDSSPGYHQTSDSYKGRKKPLRGRQATPPRSEIRPESRPLYRFETEQSRSRTSYQEDWNFPHRSDHRSGSNSYSSRIPVSSQRTPSIPYSGYKGTFSYHRNTTAKSNNPSKSDPEPNTPLKPLTKKGKNEPKPETISKEQCSICLNDVRDKVSLKCEHSFCYECLVKWCATKETCPLCRSKITQLNEMDRSLPNQRMVATFFCTCGNKWKSSYAYNGIKQGCRVCKREVAASDQRPQKRISNQINSFLGLFPQFREKESSHKQHLCGMCKLLGRDCSRQDTLGDDDDLLDIVGLENLMALFNLSESTVDQMIGEGDWSNPFSDPEDMLIEELGLDLYDPVYDEYEGDYDVYSLDDIDQIDWDPDWDNV